MGEAGFQHVRKMLDIGEMLNLHSRDYDNQDKLQNVDKILATHFAPSSASAGIAMLGDMRSLAATAKCLAICSISSKVKGDLFSKRRLSVDKGIFVAPASASMLSRREPSSARIFDTASLLRLK